MKRGRLKARLPTRHLKSNVRSNTLSLYLKQAPVLAIGPGDQFRVRTLLNNAAVIEHEDTVEPLHS